MKVLIIYVLEEVSETDFFDDLKENLKCDGVVCFVANNRLVGTQYPYFIIKEYP